MRIPAMVPPVGRAMTGIEQQIYRPYRARKLSGLTAIASTAAKII